MWCQRQARCASRCDPNGQLLLWRALESALTCISKLFLIANIVLLLQDCFLIFLILLRLQQHFSACTRAHVGMMPLTPNDLALNYTSFFLACAIVQWPLAERTLLHPAGQCKGGPSSLFMTPTVEGLEATAGQARQGGMQGIRGSNSSADMGQQQGTAGAARPGPKHIHTKQGKEIRRSCRQPCSRRFKLSLKLMELIGSVCQRCTGSRWPAEQRPASRGSLGRRQRGSPGWRAGHSTWRSRPAAGRRPRP